MARSWRRTRCWYVDFVSELNRTDCDAGFHESTIPSYQRRKWSQRSRGDECQQSLRAEPIQLLRNRHNESDELNAVNEHFESHESHDVNATNEHYASDESYGFDAIDEPCLSYDSDVWDTDECNSSWTYIQPIPAHGHI